MIPWKLSNPETIYGTKKPGIGKNKRTAKFIGGGAAAGSVIGAIAAERVHSSAGLWAEAPARKPWHAANRFTFPLNPRSRSGCSSHWLQGQTILDVFHLQRVPQQRITRKVEHPQREIIAGPPVSVYFPKLACGYGWFVRV
jgi:hypothetical protein